MIHLFVAAVLVLDPPTTSTSRPLTLAELRQEQAERTLATVADLPALLPARPIAQVISLELRNGLISVRSDLRDSDGVRRISLTDLPGITTIRVSPGDALAQRAGHLDFQHVDTAPPGKIYELLQVFAIDDRVQLATDSGTPRVDSRMQLIQAASSEDSPEDRVRLYFDDFDATTEEQLRHGQLTARTFTELWRAHPAEVYERVIEPLRRRNLHAGLLATPAPLAWQTLGDEIAPPDELRGKVDALVEQLNSEEYSKRESAAQALRDLGAPAAIVLRRLDRAALSEEQRQSIDSLLAPYAQVDQKSIDALLASREFLLGCLYCDDPAIWPAAARRIEQRLGVKVNPASDVRAMRAEADRVLDLLMTPPSTQPR